MDKTDMTEVRKWLEKKQSESDDLTFIPEIEKNLQKNFYYLFSCLERKRSDRYAFLLYFEFWGKIVEVNFQTFFDIGQAFDVHYVELIGNTLYYTTEPEEKYHRQIARISRTFLNYIKELNHIRLLEVTGLFEINEDVIETVLKV